MINSHITLSSNAKSRNQQSQYGLSTSDLITKLSKSFYPLLKTPYFWINTENGQKNLKASSLNISELKYKNSRNHKTKWQKRRDKHNILTIDLRKIEEDIGLSPKEKVKLKKILDHIRIENKDENSHTRIMSQMTSTNGTISKKVSNKQSNVIVEESQNSVCAKKFSNNKIKNCKKSASNYSTCKVNRPTAMINKSNYEQHKNTKLLPNQTRSFKQPTQEPSGHSDYKFTKSMHKPLLVCANRSYSTTRVILRAKPEMFLKYLRSNYISPSCIVQYSTDETEDYSRATMKAHLGQGQCPVSCDKPEYRKNTDSIVNDDEEDEYVIAKGKLTASELDRSFKVLKEVRKSLFPNISCSSEDCVTRRSINIRGRSLNELVNKIRKRTTTKEMEAEPSKTLLKTSKSFILPSPEPGRFRKPHWDVESFPSTLLNLEKDVKKTGNPINKIEKEHRKKSALNKVVGFFMKTCFCLCFDDYTNSSYEKIYTKSQSSRPKNITKPTKLPRSNFKKEYKIIRTTESQFLNKTPKTA